MSVVTMFIIENDKRDRSIQEYLLGFFFWPLLLSLFLLVVLFEVIGRLRLWTCKRTYGKRFSWQFWKQ